MLAAVLKSWGRDVTSAEDGSEAWRLLSEPDPAAPETEIDGHLKGDRFRLVSPTLKLSRRHSALPFRL